ncbi:MAG: YhdP family protein, partial [Burkholderiaceae bacterium]
MSTQRTFFHRIANRGSHAWRRVRVGYRVLNRITHHALSLALTGLLALYFLFCGTVLTLRYVVLPNIDRYKPNVEQMASKAVSRPVSIATIHASWHGLNPHLVLNDVVVHKRNGEAALSLPRVSATLSWKSLMVADLRLNYLQVDRPDVEVERSAEGILSVGGMEIEKGGTDDGRGLEWLLSQHEIVVRNGWIRWRDAQRGAPELRLEKVDFLLRNQWRHHRFAFKATPPAELGAPLDVRADFSHPSFARRISDLRRWTGTVYADWRDTELARWRPYIDYPIELHQGKGAVRAWLDFDQARVAGFTADLALTGLWARLGAELEPLRLKHAQGRVAASEVLGGAEEGVPTLGAFGHAIALSDFSMETDDGLKLPPTTISETHIVAADKMPARTEVRATLLDLQTIASFVGRLPLDETRRHLLADIAPRGRLHDFTASWQGEFPEISAYQVKGRFSDLSIAPRPARDDQPATPGFANLTGSIDASERAGGITLASTDATLHLPGLLSEAALPFDTLGLQANWVRRQQQLQIDVGHLQFSQQGMAGMLSGKYQASLVNGHVVGPGTVDLTGKLDGFDVTKIGRFLPVATSPKLRAWLTGALEAGRARDVALVLKGDLAHFPFAAGQRQRGQFLVSGRIEDGRLNYTPGDVVGDAARPLWPLLEKINGKFTFERSRMEIHADSAQTSKVRLSNVDAVIA